MRLHAGLCLAALIPILFSLRITSSGQTRSSSRAQIRLIAQALRRCAGHLRPANKVSVEFETIGRNSIRGQVTGYEVNDPLSKGSAYGHAEFKGVVDPPKLTLFRVRPLSDWSRPGNASRQYCSHMIVAMSRALLAAQKKIDPIGWLILTYQEGSDSFSVAILDHQSQIGVDFSLSGKVTNVILVPGR